MEIKQFLLQGWSKKTTPTAGNRFPPQTCQRNKAKSNNSPKDVANLSREGLSACLMEKYFSSQVCNDPTCMIHYCTVSAVVLSNEAAQCFLQSLKQIAPRTPESSRLY